MEFRFYFIPLSLFLNSLATLRYRESIFTNSFTIEKEIRVIHNFFDPTRFKPAEGLCQRSEFAKDDEFLLMHVSNFRPVKRTLDVIDIFDKVQAKLPAKLVLIGEGPDTILARRQITKKGLTNKVVFLGNQNRVEAVLRCADLFLIPSEEESFGLAALEALACGVPVIGTSGTGLSEVVDDGQDGYLLPVGDTNAMAQMAYELLNDKNELVKFKNNAARIAAQKFTADKIVTQYEKYYEEILGH